MIYKTIIREKYDMYSSFGYRIILSFFKITFEISINKLKGFYFIFVQKSDIFLKIRYHFNYTY